MLAFDVLVLIVAGVFLTLGLISGGIGFALLRSAKDCKRTKTKAYILLAVGAFAELT